MSDQNPSLSSTVIQKKVVIATCFGTFLEWYDFLTFASLATYFSTLFFPQENPVAALLASLATFGVGMLKMTAEEVWRAITINAAKALGLEKKVGSITVGKQADLVLWDAPDEIYPLYRYSKDCVAHVFAKGQKVC